MGAIERLKKLRNERAAEIGKLGADVKGYNVQIQQLEEKINQAIDAGNTDLVEELINKQHEIKVKIEAAERTISRKSVQNEDFKELVQEANKETAEYQRKIDKAEEAVKAARKACRQ